MTQENDRPAHESGAIPTPENVPPAPSAPPHAGDTFASPAEGYAAGSGQQEPGRQRAAHAVPMDAGQGEAGRTEAGQYDAGQRYPAPPYQDPQYQSSAYPGLPAAAQQYPDAGYQYPAGYAAPGAGYGYQAPPAKTLSLISMVLGIVSVATLGSTFFTQIAAVVLGHIALKREPAGRGMALAGLIMGYVTIGLGILLVILAIIFFAAWAPYFSTTSGAEFTV